MKKAIVLFIICFPAMLFAKKETISAKSDNRGENVEITIRKDGIAVVCDMSGNGRLDSFGIQLKNVAKKGDEANFTVHISEKKVSSVYFNYRGAATAEYFSSILYANKPDGKEVAGLMENLARMLEKKYGLAKLARETAEARRKAFQEFIKEQERLEREAAEKRPKPADVIRKILDF